LGLLDSQCSTHPKSSLFLTEPFKHVSLVEFEINCLCLKIENLQPTGAPVFGCGMVESYQLPACSFRCCCFRMYGTNRSGRFSHSGNKEKRMAERDHQGLSVVAVVDSGYLHMLSSYELLAVNRRYAKSLRKTGMPDAVAVLI
ncbi:MAG: hypothetical protein KDE58_05125, partial [Caldilineaceae bacterium]|nr:hypothetical protein [Caldilineaceae bacterium]